MASKTSKKLGILVSIVAIALCVVLITGSTFSLFTGETNADITISAGEVKLTADIDDSTFALYSLDVYQGKEYFANGGKATLSGADLSLENVTPGDRVEFDIVVDNDSTVLIQYRITWAITGELKQHLVTNVDNSTSQWAEWAPLTAEALEANPDAQNVKTHHVSIELPKEVNNDAFNDSAEITFYLEAVQANATGLYSSDAYVSTADGLQAALDAGATEIYFNNDIETNETIVVSAAAEEQTPEAPELRTRKRAEAETEIEGVVFYMNGYALTGKGESDVLVNNGTLTIVKGAIVSEATEGAAIVNNGTATIVDSKINGAAASESETASYAVENSGTMTITNTTITAANGAVASYDEGVVTLNNVKATNTTDTATILTYTEGQVVIEGGQYENSAESGTAIEGNVVINSGSVSGEITGSEEAGTPTVNGGTFDGEVSEELIPEGFYAQKLGDEYFVVANGTALFTNKTNMATAITDLIAKGETNITVDACGKDVGSFEYAISQRLVPAGTTVTIKNANITAQSKWNGCAGTVIFENCNFNNAKGAYSIHFDEAGEGNVVFNNCTLAGWCSFAANIKSVKMYNCEILPNAHYATLRCYQNLTLTECTLTDLNEVGSTSGFTMNLINCTINNSKLSGVYANMTETVTEEGYIIRTNIETGEVVFYNVPADLDVTEVVIPEGVTTIGGYAFANNTGIKKITLASTVTTLADRAFRDTSASVVVLNEGLTNISYQAFRNAANVTTVAIPASVKTISKEAFQNSGITALTVPATVTTIEYGAMRDMKMLETVTLEGNADIPVYAFRACTNLKTVYINGDDVTFGNNGTSRGMIFTNKENGDGSAITIYVKNETVKARLLAQDTAAKDYGGYTLVCPITVTTAEELNQALANAQPGAFINAAGLEYTIGSQLMIPAGVTISGATFNGGNTYILSSGNAADGNVVFENCVFNCVGWGTMLIGIGDATAPNIDFNGCTLNGKIYSNGTAKADGVLTFTNCNFGLCENIGLVNCMGGTSIFTKCTFDYAGGSMAGSNSYVRWCAVNSYSERYSTSVILDDCSSVATQKCGGNSTLTVK